MAHSLAPDFSVSESGIGSAGVRAAGRSSALRRKRLLRCGCRFLGAGRGQVEGAVAVGLVDCVCEGTEFARDVGCGDGTAYEEEVLSLLEWLGW